jgi:hypothetical protein
MQAEPEEVLSLTVETWDTGVQGGCGAPTLSLFLCHLHVSSLEGPHSSSPLWPKGSPGYCPEPEGPGLRAILPQHQLG